MAYSDEVLADTPLAYWQLEEASGTVLVDSSGNGRNGTWTGTPVFGATGMVDGEGTSVQFSGDDYATVPNGAWFPKSAFTYEFVVNRDALTTYGYFYLLSQQGVFDTFVNGDLTAQLSIGSSYVYGGSWADSVNTHVAFTYDGATMAIYLGGTQVATQAKTGALPASTNPILVGAKTADAPGNFKGRMQKVAVYGTALSAARISAHAAAISAAPPPEPPSTGTSTEYENDAYNLTGTASVFYDVPVTPAPSGVTRAKVMRVHQSLPAPTLVDGRPT